MKSKLLRPIYNELLFTLKGSSVQQVKIDPGDISKQENMRQGIASLVLSGTHPDCARAHCSLYTPTVLLEYKKLLSCLAALIVVAICMQM